MNPYAIAAVTSNARGSNELERLNKWAGEMSTSAYTGQESKWFSYKFDP